MRHDHVSQHPVQIGLGEMVHDEALAWMARREDRSIHAVVTDPPYGALEFREDQKAKLREGRGGVWRIPPSFDGSKRAPLPRFTTHSSKDAAMMAAFFGAFFAQVARVLTPGGHAIVATNPLFTHVVTSAAVGAGLEARGQIVRLVMTLRGGDRPKNAHREFDGVSVMARSQHEPWVIVRRPLDGTVAETLRRWGTGALRRVNAERPFGDVIDSAPTRKAERALVPHPSLKPQALMRQLVRAALPLGAGVVLDPFAGGGSTVAAGNAVGYATIGIERDAEWFALACEGIPKLATLECAV